MNRNLSRKRQNEKIVYGIVLFVILVAASMIVKSLASYYSDKLSSEECVLQQTSCCGCAMGGKEECMTLEEAEVTKERLANECSKDIFCTANYVCEEVECKMIEGQCKEVPKN